MEHSQGNENPGGHGENLAVTTDVLEMQESDLATFMWYDEINDPGYDYKKPGFAMGTGHFTQVVWENCTYVGHGIENGYVCARYNPAGNFTDQFEKMVPPLIDGWKESKAADDLIKAEKRAILIATKKEKRRIEKESTKPKTKKEFLARKLDPKDIFSPEGSTGWSSGSQTKTEGKVVTKTHTITYKFKDGHEEQEEIVEKFEG